MWEAVSPTSGETDIFEAPSTVRCHAAENHREKARQHKLDMANLLPDLPPHQQMLTTIEAEELSWLGSSVLKKSDLCDALHIWYGYPLDALPLQCVCVQPQ